MKKICTFVCVLFVLLFGLALTSFAEDYTLPQISVPPTIDGVFGADEWQGAYHKYISSTEGVIYSTEKIDLGNATYDIYMTWFYDGSEERSGLYFFFDAHDTSLATGLLDKDLTAWGLSPWGALTDKIFLAIDGYNLHADSNEKTLMITLTPYSNSDRKGPPLFFEQSYHGLVTPPDIQISSVVDEDGYVIELFVPYEMIGMAGDTVSHKVGDQIGIGLVVFDYAEGLANYNASDFGLADAGSVYEFAFKSRYLNTVTLGDVEVYPPSYVPIDKTEFVGLLQQADLLLMNGLEYTTESIEALRAAILNSKNYIYNITEEVLEEYVETLRTALNSLVKRGYNETQDLLTAIASLNKNDFTDASWTALQGKVAVASTVTNEMTKGAIVAVYEDLLNAYEHLVHKANNEYMVDSTALDRLLTESATYVAMKNRYTTESWTAYEQALNAAKALNKTANVQSEYNLAVADLQNAQDGLKRLSTAQIVDEEIGEGDMDVVLLIYLILVGVAVLVAAVVVVVKQVQKKVKKS